MRDRNRGTCSRASLGAVVLVALGLGALPLIGPASTASAVPTPAVVAAPVTEGQELVSTTTYRIDPDTGQVRVEARYGVTNTTPDKTTSTGRIEYYFTGLTVPIETGVEDLAVTVDDRVVTTETTPFEDDNRFSVLDITYGRRLDYRETFAVRVTYVLPAAAPRSENPARSNPAYAAFTAYGFADPGRATVRIEVPTAWTSEYVGDDLVEEPGFGVTVYLATDIADPEDFAVLFTARNDDGLESSRISAGDEAFEIRSWPGDDEWREFVERHVRDGIPVLEDLIGEDWPEEKETEVVEAYTPYLRGYAGWYDPELDVLEVGEDLDDQTVLHELSHAWFNRSRFTERWLNEGLAEEYASRAVGELGGKPIAPDSVSPEDRVAIPLNRWTAPLGDADETEDYGYNASFTVMRALVDEIGLDGMRTVFGAAADGLIAYRGDGPPETGYSTSVDWRRFLDLAEEYGGSTTFEQLLRRWVVTPSEAPSLDERAAARTKYAALAREGDGWAPPRVVRTSMDAWDFDTAEQRMTEATEVLARRDAMRAVLAQARVDEPPEIETLYEGADTDFSAVGDLIESTRADAQALIDRREETDAAVARAAAVLESADGFFVDLGLRGTDLDTRLAAAKELAATDDFDAATAEAQAVVERVEAAERIGKERALKVAGAALGALVLLLVLVWFLVRRRRRRRTREEPPAPAEWPVPPPLDVPAPPVAPSPGWSVSPPPQAPSSPPQAPSSPPQAPSSPPTGARPDPPPPAWGAPPPAPPAG